MRSRPEHGDAGVTQRILSISGLRGIVGDGLDPTYIVEFASALGTLFKGGTVIVTRDGRLSGSMIRDSVVSALVATGCRVIDAGIAATPTCGVLVTHHRAAGGLQITASHNPIEWNGLKPFTSEGSVFDERRGAQLLALLESKKFDYRNQDTLGSVESTHEVSGPHIDRVLRLVNVELIHQRRPRVILDCNHGSGAVATPGFLEQLGCEVRVLGGTPDGRFEHVPDPSRDNLGSLCEAVRESDADVGFAQDPDADRLAIVDGDGRYIGEELTLALAADYVLARTPGPIVVNGSTSRVTADIAAKYQCAFHRSSVGEAHVCAKMKAVSAIIGGEGNGGVIEPQVGYVRDSFVAMAYALAGIADSGQTLAEWTDLLPRYSIVKDRLNCPRECVGRAVQALRSVHADATAHEGDGLRLDWDDRWVQVRASNTEPILRVIAEAPERESAERLCSEALGIISDAVKL